MLTRWMCCNRSPQAERGSSQASQALIWGGITLLVLGCLLLWPYVESRMAPIPPTVTPLPPVAVVVTAEPSSTVVPPSPPTAPAAATSSPKPPPVPPSPSPTPARPSRIVIPAIGVDGPVVPVSWATSVVNGQAQAIWDVPDEYAAGWHATSAPLGAGGNTVINGHNTTHGEIFRDLYKVQEGDEIIVYSGDVPYTYTVSAVQILPEAGQPLEVRMANARYILPTDDERLTLVTCHPYASMRYRLVVVARPAYRTPERDTPGLLHHGPLP